MIGLLLLLGLFAYFGLVIFMTRDKEESQEARGTDNHAEFTRAVLDDSDPSATQT